MAMLPAYAPNATPNPLSHGQMTAAGAGVGALSGAALGFTAGWVAYVRNGGDDFLAPMLFGILGVPIGALTGATVGFVRGRSR